MQYCTATEVMNVLQLFKKDFQDSIDTISTEEVEDIITEATEHIRILVSEKYDLAEIEALSTIPPVINFATKLNSAFLILDRYNPLSLERNKELKSILQQSYNTWVMAIKKGFILDSDGSEIDNQREPRLLNNSTNVTNLNTILAYRNGGCT